MLEETSITVLDTTFWLKPNNVIYEFPTILDQASVEVERNGITFACMCTTYPGYNDGRCIHNKETALFCDSMYSFEHFFKKIEIMIITWIN